MNSLQFGLGQKMRCSQGVLYCCTDLRKSCWSSRTSNDFIVVPGMGCVQHLGGILDSSFVA